MRDVRPLAFASTSPVQKKPLDLLGGGWYHSCIRSTLVLVIMKRALKIRVLADAISWQESFLDSLGSFDPKVADRSRELLDEYRAEFKKLTGRSEPYPEVEGTNVSIWDI